MIPRPKVLPPTTILNPFDKSNASGLLESLQIKLLELRGMTQISVLSKIYPLAELI